MNANPHSLASTPEDSDFEAFVRQTRELFEQNLFTQGLDRLHAYTAKFVRGSFENHGVMVTRDKTLQSLLDEYLEKLQSPGHQESAMSVRILRMSIASIHAFNDLHDARSVARNNKALTYAESVLIFDRVASAVRFVNSLDT